MIFGNTRWIDILFSDAHVFLFRVFCLGLFFRAMCDALLRFGQRFAWVFLLMQLLVWLFLGVQCYVADVVRVSSLFLILFFVVECTSLLFFVKSARCLIDG